MIELKKISKRFGDNLALRDISLTIQTGASVAIVGPSGCGKSTLLRVMVGLIEADSGEISFDNVPLHNDLRAIRLKMGYVIQSSGLFPHLTAFENVALPATTQEFSRVQLESRIHELCDMVRFPRKRLSHYPVQLSGGERQRVGIMRALMLDPNVLFLDEPFGALDPVTRNGLQDEVKGLIDNLKKTVVLVTHDLVEADFLAKEIVILKNGQIEQAGGMGELQDNPENTFVSEFVQAQRS